MSFFFGYTSKGALNEFTRKETTEYPKSFYSFVDKIEMLEDEKLEIHLDSIREEDFRAESSGTNYILEVPTYNIILEVLPREMYKLFGDDSVECNWFKIKLTSTENDTSVDLFEENDNPNIGDGVYTSYIEKIERPSGEAIEALKKAFSLDELKDASKDEIIRALSLYMLGGNVIAYNVGQGNLTAICGYDNAPVVYVDLGGGCYRNAFTYPNLLRICISYMPPVILTHWDMDHIWTAHKSHQLFKGFTWIVPRQPLNVTQRKFLKRLQQNGNTILVYPSVMTRIDTPICTIVKCTGPATDKNESGLAVYTDLLRIEDESLKVLLPGDASYTNISHLNDTDLAIGGLIATHHGAEFQVHNTPVPPANSLNRIIYSNGVGNSYRHPKINAVNAHQGAGWNNSLSTNAGSISFGHIVAPMPAPCGNANCDLSIFQSF